MARLSFVTAVLALVAGAAAQSSSLANPFTAAGIPPLSALPICQNECATVAQLQANWTGDYSSACTATFASSLSTCMSCVAASAVGAALLTPQTEQQLAQALASYESSCQQAGSPVTINLSSVLAATPTVSTSIAGSGTASATGSSNTASHTGAGSKTQLAVGSVVGAMAFVAVNLL